MDPVRFPHTYRGFVMVRGVGRGSTPLNAFDSALHDAGVSQFNLVKVSSILPPGVPPAETLSLVPGSLLPIAYGAKVSSTRNERITAAVAVAIPESSAEIGVIMEYSGELSPEDAHRLVEGMAREAMAMREIPVREVRVASVSTVVEDGPTAVFAGVALIPGDGS